MNRKIDGVAHRQLTLALDVLALRGLGARERAEAVARLAQLLLEASAVVRGEGDDEDR